MSIQSFIQDSEREIDIASFRVSQGLVVYSDVAKAIAFNSLRELIGEVKKGVEGMREKVRHHESCLSIETGSESYCDCYHPEQWRSHNSALDSVLNLLDGIDK